MAATHVIDLCESSNDDDDQDDQEPPRKRAAKRRRRTEDTPAADSPSSTNAISTFASSAATSNVGSPVLILQTEPQEDVVATVGLMPLLRRYSNVSDARKANLKHMCHSSTLLHIQQRDKWSCGFRNLQMLLSALLPLLPANHAFFADRPLDSAGAFDIMSLLQIQYVLEEAWASGMDRAGCEHYKGKLAHSRALIGAVEAATALNFCKVDATVVQFITVPESRRQLGAFCGAYFSHCEAKETKRPSSRSSHQLASCLLEQLKSAPSNVTVPTAACSCCPKVPLYLQYVGHSVSIVGVEYSCITSTCVASESVAHPLEVINLLVFDPLKSGTKLQEAVEQQDFRPLRRSCNDLYKKDCQVVLCSSAEYHTKSLSVITASEQAVIQFRKSHPTRQAS